MKIQDLYSCAPLVASPLYIPYFSRVVRGTLLVARARACVQALAEIDDVLNSWQLLDATCKPLLYSITTQQSCRQQLLRVGGPDTRSLGVGPIAARGDHIRQPQTVRGDRILRGTMYGVTVLQPTCICP